MKDFLPHPLYQLHQSFLTSKRYNVLWETNFVYLLFYGLIFNLLLLGVYTYIQQDAPPLQALPSDLDTRIYWLFRIPSIIGFLFWAWSTYQHNAERDFARNSSFRLRARFLVYFTGVFLSVIPLELCHLNWDSNETGIIASIILLGCFVISILLNLGKIASFKSLAFAIVLSIPIAVVAFFIALLVGILGQGNTLLKPISIVLSYIPITFFYLIGTRSPNERNMRRPSKVGEVLLNIGFPFLFVQLSLIITLVYSFSSAGLSFFGAIYLHIIPVIGYCTYVYLLPKLIEFIRKAEAKPF